MRTESEASVESLLFGDPAQLFQPHDVADGPWLIREGRERSSPPQAQGFVAKGDGPSRVSCFSRGARSAHELGEALGVDGGRVDREAIAARGGRNSAFPHDRAESRDIGAHRLHGVLDFGAVEERLHQVIDRHGVVRFDQERTEEPVLRRPAEREDALVLAHHLDPSEDLVPHAHPPRWRPKLVARPYDSTISGRLQPPGRPGSAD